MGCKADSFLFWEGDRYSNSPIFEQGDYAQRGEPLFLEARKLLKLDYDLASFTVVQAYVLMATYHLTYGGARKAWLHLGRLFFLFSRSKISQVPDCEG